MKNKIYYINEGRHFDISDEDRNVIVNAGLKFYKQYNGYVERGNIHLTKDDGSVVVLPYNSDIFVS